MIPRHFCTQIARHNNTNGEVHFGTIVDRVTNEILFDQFDICDTFCQSDYFCDQFLVSLGEV